MSKYTPHSSEEIKQMLETIGLSSVQSLFDDVPANLRIDRLNIEDGKSQMQVEGQFTNWSRLNKVYSTILRGAGAYDHYIPAAVSSLSTREEFLTAYTPYQAEISQGILQAIFEYQTMVCNLSGMNVSNASVYDGATSAAEAITMCCDKSKKVLVVGGVNKDTLAVLQTYAFGCDIDIRLIECKDGLTDIDELNRQLSGGDIACVVAQCPNFVGLIEDMALISQTAHQFGAKFIYIYNPITATLLPSPGEVDADIACAEGQPLGMSLSWGGPYLGMLSCTKAMSRRLVGRIVGQTVDKSNRLAYVLTLQAREQHIRREKATSSICSNQALCALTAVVYTSLMGRDGLIDVASQSISKSHYFADKLCQINGIKLKFKSEFAYEFVTVCDKTDEILSKLDKHNILGGLKLSSNEILWCVTEKVTKEVLDTVISIVSTVVRG